MVDVADPQYAGLQAWWKMDEGCGLVAAAAMAGAADGTLATPVWTTSVGSLSAAFSANCYIGLAVASGSNAALNSSQFCNVSVTP